eukprot:365451-Chlamydomonas_euryale.AAC.2
MQRPRLRPGCEGVDVVVRGCGCGVWEKGLREEVLCSNAKAKATSRLRKYKYRGEGGKCPVPDF